MIHLAYLQYYRLVVGQKQLRSRLEFYFGGNFTGGRASLKVDLIGRDKEPQFLFCLVFFGL